MELTNLGRYARFVAGAVASPPAITGIATSITGEPGSFGHDFRLLTEYRAKGFESVDSSIRELHA